MAIALPGLDRLPPGPLRDFVVALHELYDTAGQPSARIISKAIYGERDLRETVSHETVSSTLRGTTVPAWAKVESIVRVLSKQSISAGVADPAAQVGRFHELWLEARRETARLGADTPPDAGRRPEQIVKPPLPIPTSTVFRPQILAARRPVSGERVVGIRPSRNPFFTGREILLDAMSAKLQEQPHAPLVVYGVGGAGKTQLALEFLELHAEQYPVTWWVPADRPELARASLVDLAERLGVPHQQSTDQTVAGVISALESDAGHFLLVFDGAESDEIRRLMPSFGGHVIVTTRDPALAHDSSSNALEVGDFSRAEAIQFLRRRAVQLSGAQSDELGQLVGRLPLALEQVAALQAATGQPWDALTAHLRELGPGLLTQGQPQHYPHTVAASLQLALMELEAANPTAALILELFAWFGSEPVSLMLLRGGRAGEVSGPLARVLGNPIQLHKAVAEISRFGLARIHEGQRIEVQPLVRRALRDVLTDDAQQRAKRNVQAILTAADPGMPDDLASWDMHREMAAHVLPAGLVSAREEPMQWTVLHQIRYRYLIGDFEEAQRLGEEAVRVWGDPRFLGPDHELVLLAVRELANALRSLGRYQAAHELTADAWARLHANPKYGADHPHTLAMGMGYAADLRIAGDYRQALSIDEQTYSRMLELYGPDNARVAASRHNLAVSLRLVGNFTAAHAVDLEELSRREASLGFGSSIMWSVNALAEDLFGLGRYTEVLTLQERYLRADHQLFSRTDRSALLTGRTVALARRRLGAHAAAVDALRSHYHDCITAFGADHEYSLAAEISYANALRQVGQFGEAYGLAADAVASYQRMLGPRNPLTLAAEVNLAAILRASGDRGRARQTDVVASEVLRETVGAEHPFLIAATMNLATDLALVNDHEHARLLSQRAHDLAQRILGADHLDTWAAAANLSVDLAATGDNAAADALAQQVIARFRRLLGADHPDVTAVASGLRLERDIEPPST